MFSDDDSHRNHFLANYGDEDDGKRPSGAGTDYDSVKPAYSFGAEMRGSELYRNRPWDDVEGELARAWHAHSGRSASMHGAWDRMKAAVRHGWDRMTSH